MSVDEIAMRTGGGASFDDQVFERLLRERIIFLGSEVNDEVTNRIIAEVIHQHEQIASTGAVTVVDDQAENHR